MTQDELKECLHYNPETGVFTWINSRRKDKNGKVAGCVDKGYIIIGINKKLYRAHRLAFLYMTGSIPREVDHINGKRGDNSWKNLRSVEPGENQRNLGLSDRNKTGVTGVQYQADKSRWAATINNNVCLGYFKTKDEAVKARKKAEKEYGYHENHGKRPVMHRDNREKAISPDNEARLVSYSEDTCTLNINGREIYYDRVAISPEVNDE